MGEKTKSSRPTLFISFTDATEENVSNLYNSLKPLEEDYRLIVTPKPMQALGEKDMAEVLRIWTEYNYDETKERQMNHVRVLSFRNEKVISSFIKEIECINENLQQIEQTFIDNANRMETEINLALRHAANGHYAPVNFDKWPYARLVAKEMDAIRHHLQIMQLHTPVEGAEW